MSKAKIDQRIHKNTANKKHIQQNINNVQQKDKPQFRLLCIGCTKAKRNPGKIIMNWRCGCIQYILFRSIYSLIFWWPRFSCFSFCHLSLSFSLFLFTTKWFVACKKKVEREKKISFRLVVEHLHIDALVL